MTMSLSLRHMLGGRQAVSAPPSGPETGDAIAFTVLAGGFQSELAFQGLSTGGAYSLTPDATPKAIATVQRPGYDATGATTTHNDAVVLTVPVKQAWPNQANPTEDANSGNAKVTIAGSEHIFDNDNVSQVALLSGAYDASTAVTLVTGITNNSTLAAPKVIARWADAPKQLFNGDLVVEVVAVQQFGRNQLPAACVKITGTPTTGSAVTKTCTYGKSAKYGDDLPVFKATFNASTDFPSNGNADVTYTYQAFPWIGGASQIRDTSAGTFPSGAAEAPQVHRQGTVTVRYAYVSTTGNDGTAVVSTTAATAKAAPFATDTAAMTALIAAASGDLSGCVLRYMAGTHTWTNTSPTGTRAAANTWFICEGDPDDADPYNNVVIQTSTTTYKQVFNNGSGTMSWIQFRNLGVTIAAGFQGFVSGNSLRATVWLNNVKFVTDMAASTTWLSGCYLIVTGGSATASNASGRTYSLSSTNRRPLLLRAISSNRRLDANAMLSFEIDASGIGDAFMGLGDTSNLAPDNVIALNGRVTNWLGNSGPGITVPNGGTVIKDVALVQVEVDCSDSCSQPLLALGENNAIDVDNVMFDYVTVIPGANADGGRLNVHNDPSTNPTTAVSDQVLYTNFSVKRSKLAWMAVKDDAFHGVNESDTGAGYLTGGWPKRYGVGCRDNSSAYSPDSFAPEYFGLNSARASATARSIPSGTFYQAQPYDLDGVARLTNGSGVSGAVGP